jgi:hypothetical protein
LPGRLSEIRGVWGHRLLLGFWSEDRILAFRALNFHSNSSSGFDEPRVSVGKCGTSGHSWNCHGTSPESSPPAENVSTDRGNSALQRNQSPQATAAPLVETRIQIRSRSSLPDVSRMLVVGADGHTAYGNEP